MVTHHLGIRRHHQLDVARVGEEALASAWGFGRRAGGAVVVNVLIIDGGSERVQLLSHTPYILKSNRLLGVFCLKKENW